MTGNGMNDEGEILKRVQDDVEQVQMALHKFGDDVYIVIPVA